MNIRTKFLIGFCAACIATAILPAITAQFISRFPVLRWAPLAEWAAAFAFVYWWFRRFRGRLPKPTPKQLSKAARSARDLSVIYIVAPVLAYLVDGSKLIALPDGLGFILPLFPFGLAVYYLRLSARLKRERDTAGTPSPQ